ncbi:MAG: ArgE/DapE family deacylase [bacterium]
MDDILGEVKGKVNDYKNYLISVLDEIVSIPTVNPPGDNYYKLSSILDERLKQIGLSTMLILAPPEFCGLKDETLPRYSVMGERIIEGRPLLHLNGHIDVVPPTSGWTRDPFKMVIDGDRIYGRGCADMKGTIASMLTAIRVISDMEIDVGIQVSFTCDEETGGEAGAGFLAREGYIKGDLGIVEGVHGPVITVANKGLIWHEVSVIGKASHGSRPYLGLNAFKGGVRVAEALFSLEDEMRDRKTDMDVYDERHSHITMNIGGIISGGTKPNTLCDRFTFTIDTRVIPEFSSDDVDKRVQEMVKGALKGEDYNYEIKKLADMESVVGLSDSSLKSKVGSAFSEIMGVEPKFCLAPFFSDMRHLVSAGIMTIGIGCECDGIHGDDEWVSLNGLLKMSEVIVNIARKL